MAECPPYNGILPEEGREILKEICRKAVTFPAGSQPRVRLIREAYAIIESRWPEHFNKRYWAEVAKEPKEKKNGK